MGITASKGCDQLINRVDTSGFLPKQLQLNTKFAVLRKGGAVTFIDTATLPSSCQNEATRENVDVLMGSYDTLMGELSECAREGFDTKRHKKSPWSKLAKAEKERSLMSAADSVGLTVAVSRY